MINITLNSPASAGLEGLDTIPALTFKIINLLEVTFTSLLVLSENWVEQRKINLNWHVSVKTETVTIITTV